jgi:phosphoserine phosphatase
VTSSPRTTLLVTVTGRDKPGVVSVIFSALTRHGVDILDVEQVVIRGRIILGVLVTTTADPDDLQEAAEQAMASIGMQVEVEVGAGAVGAMVRGSTHVVLVLGRPVTAWAFTETTRALATLNINIDAIRRIADYPVTGLELLVSAPPGGDPQVADAALRSTWPSNGSVSPAAPSAWWSSTSTRR